MNKFIDEYKDLPYKLHYNEENSLDIVNYNNSTILDLIDTFFSISYHDFLTRRDENVDNSIKLKVSIPVNNYFLFLKIKDTLQELLKYMTNGENWEINFIKINKEKNITLNKLEFEYRKFNSIALLSGGLDALAGASQEIKNNTTIFVTYGTNDIEKNKARTIFKSKLKPNTNAHVIIDKLPIPPKISHLPQRTRTLAFFASAFLYADAYKINTIKVYENGIMSLNPRFYFRRYVTKTTHPKTIYLINQILEKLLINFRIINPFNYMTKTEVINLIPNDWKDVIANTKTCSKMSGSKAFNNRNKSKICHCGLCMACLLREVSILNSKFNVSDVEYILPSEISSFDSIMKYEINNGNNKSNKIVVPLCLFKYNEKKSLLEYYQTFYELINNKKIIYYLDLNPKFFTNTSDYLDKYNKMLNKFKKELNNYFQNLN